jgi:N-acetylmuramoyl-L-alanine amidase
MSLYLFTHKEDLILLHNALKVVVAAFLLLLSVTQFDASIATAETSTATINTPTLNVRGGPGLSYNVVKQVHKGEKFSILERKNDWLKIKLSGHSSGWVAEWLVSTKGTSNATSGSSNTKTALIKGNGVNVRSQPSTNSSIIGKVNNGHKVTIVSESGNWYKIKHSNKNAWIHRDYVTFQSSTEPFIANTSTTSKTGVVLVSSLNIRDKASLSGQVVGSIKRGNTITILSESNGWYEILLSTGTKGWVANYYISLHSAPSSQQSVSKPNQSSSKKVQILENGTNLRSGPSTSNRVVARANAGDTFDLIETKGDWYQIKLSNNKVAYIAGWLASVSGSRAQVERPGGVNQYLRNKTIVLDPGHGGNDSGAIGARGTFEKNVTLRTSRLVYEKLNAAGANVIMTRNSDTYVGLPSRVSMSHYQNADAFISVHYDSIRDSSVNGITSYYYKNSDVALASSLQSEIIKYTRMKNRGYRQESYQVLRNNRQPSTLLELGYLSNVSEEIKINSAGFQENVSNGIYYGLAQYFKNK